MTLKLNAAVHGYSGAGKSRLLATAPGPIHVLDAEGGSKWLAGPDSRVEWDPAQPLPTANEDGSPLHERTIVRTIVRDFSTVKRVFDWLLSGNHYFESVEWDSITEIQAKCKRGIRGMSDSMTQEMWGKLLDQMTDMVRAYRDLADHPTKPVNVFISAITEERGKETMRLTPSVQGALANQMPQYFDVLGYLYPEQVTSEDGNQRVERRLLIQPFGPFAAKDRTDILTQRYGMYIPNPNLTVISHVLNGLA